MLNIPFTDVTYVWSALVTDVLKSELSILNNTIFKYLVINT